ncbi:MAG: ATP-dependent RNA helicase HrpA [Chromatiales bacterium]|nr:ATP-dependent RNA helicase HrpA [Chromatiales bacterium]
MGRDRGALRVRLRKAAQRLKQGQPASRMLTGLNEDIERSSARRLARVTALPKLEYPENLPVSGRREEIEKAIRENQVVVVCGETGSGKTTQLPKICLAAGRGVDGLIGHTQPRRIAARTVAARIAEEMQTELGTVVGYKVRFKDHTNPNGYIKLMTDGILLAETQSDRLLSGYDTLIIDEAHERSLNIDFLLGYLKQLLPRRPDLKVVITSATIDPQRLARHFGGAPIIEVSGRTYPVEVRYRPLVSEDEDEQDRDLQQAIVEAVDELAREKPSDILVFLSGEGEIRETSETLRKHKLRDTEILPLFARLSLSEQARAFSAHRGRRIVLATNVAETSLTVPGIRYVIDPGRARISRYSHRSKVQRLPVEAVSQASASQRAGRCGRVADGICIRLYSEEDLQAREEFTDPEILRTNLAAVILRMQALGFGDVSAFPFVDPPDNRLINDGYRLLAELGAVDAQRKLTTIGRRLAQLPIDPRIGRMLLAAGREGALSEVLVIGAALAVQDPRERPMEARQAADQKHAVFRDEKSDFLTLLNLWNWYEEQKKHLSQSKLRKLCKENFISFLRVREWREMVGQLREMMLEGERSHLNEEPAEYAAVHRALLTGLLSQIGFLQENRDYLGARNLRFSVFPSSTLAKRTPKWIMAAELMETRKTFALNCADIRPQWVESLAGHLVNRNYSEPHWEKRAGQVGAWERVTLYGLTLVARRRVNYGPIEPEAAREIFIREALVNGELNTRAPFFQHNRSLIQEVEKLEHKSRRPDVLVDEAAIYAFYDERLPAGIYSAAAFEKWREQAEKDQPKILYLDRATLLREDGGGVSKKDFPDHLALDGLQLPLRYRFSPGEADDGVTVRVPLAVLNQLKPEPFEWLVPGLLQNRIEALLRALPKALRKSFVPVPDFARASVEALVPRQSPLLESLAEQLRRMTGVAVPADAWDAERVPDHLRMRFEVLAEDGKRVIDQGRDLALLQRRHGAKASEGFAALPHAEVEENRPMMRWEFDALPESVEMQRHGVRFQAWPALEDRGDCVARVLCDAPEKADAVHRRGVRRLLRLTLGRNLRDIERKLPGFQALCVRYTRVPAPAWLGKGTGQTQGKQLCEGLQAELVDRVLDRVFDLDERPIRNRVDFESRVEQRRGRIVDLLNQTLATLQSILSLHQELRAQLSGRIPPAWLAAVQDLRSQLDHLVYRGFLTDTPDSAFDSLPRYLKAIEIRLQRLTQDPGRDARRMNEVIRHWEQCLQRLEKARAQGRPSEELRQYRWMIEEFRVSLFAQELKTAYPISEKRLMQQWRLVTD